MSHTAVNGARAGLPPGALHEVTDGYHMLATLIDGAWRAAFWPVKGKMDAIGVDGFTNDADAMRAARSMAVVAIQCGGLPGERIQIVRT